MVGADDYPKLTSDRFDRFQIREKSTQSLARRRTDPCIRNQPGHQGCRCDVKGQIPDSTLCPTRRNLPSYAGGIEATNQSDFLLASFFKRNLPPIVERPVDTRQGDGSIERNPGLPGCECERQGPNLVAHIALSCRPVGPHKNNVDFAPLQEMGGHGVADDRVGYPARS